jgi:hypothetical protein
VFVPAALPETNENKLTKARAAMRARLFFKVFR